jgi:hypothetical protein
MTQTIKTKRGLAKSIKVISVVQILLYVLVFWIALAARDPESTASLLVALVPYYLFILLGVFNVCLTGIYFYLTTKAHQRYDRGVLGFIFILLLLVILNTPLIDKVLY